MFFMEPFFLLVSFDYIVTEFGSHHHVIPIIIKCSCFCLVLRCHVSHHIIFSIALVERRFSNVFVFLRFPIMITGPSPTKGSWHLFLWRDPWRQLNISSMPNQPKANQKLLLRFLCGIDCVGLLLSLALSHCVGRPMAGKSILSWSFASAYADFYFIHSIAFFFCSWSHCWLSSHYNWLQTFFLWWGRYDSPSCMFMVVPSFDVAKPHHASLVRDPSLVSISHQHDKVLTSCLLTVPSAPDAWAGPLEAELLLDTFFWDGNDKDLDISITLVSFADHWMNDSLFLRVKCTSFSRVILFFSVFQYAKWWSECLDTCFFVLVISSSVTAFIVW